MCAFWHVGMQMSTVFWCGLC